MHQARVHSRAVARVGASYTHKPPGRLDLTYFRRQVVLAREAEAHSFEDVVASLLGQRVNPDAFEALVPRGCRMVGCLRREVLDRRGLNILDKAVALHRKEPAADEVATGVLARGINKEIALHKREPTAEPVRRLIQFSAGLDSNASSVRPPSP